jgi:FkbH-like protein
MRLANKNLDFVKTNALDQVLSGIDEERRCAESLRSVKLAILSSCTTTHLHASLRMACLRRRFVAEIYECEYGQYWQELVDKKSGLYSFRPNFLLFVLDGHHLTVEIGVGDDAATAASTVSGLMTRLRHCWSMARESFGCQVLQQIPLQVHPPLLGSNERRFPGSKRAVLRQIQEQLRVMADMDGVDIVAADERAEIEGLASWYDMGLWHRSKQEVSAARAPVYGDLVARVIAARLGATSKCLVLDLDNTIWGGVVGDDGLEGLSLGQGSALGEAFTAFQQFALALSRRGVILAVCSKNDEANALEPFERHPEMVLKRDNVACFVANWSDKATNIKAIAEELNIGLDSLVFADDNPFERSLVRQELPMVAVPELGDDPTHYPRIIADAGYFEGVAVTDEDRERSGHYQSNRGREALKAASTDLATYLRGLEMRLRWSRFNRPGLTRIVQLINKTNQFNLTTRRYMEEEVVEVMSNPSAFGLQLRLIDRFGDNGIISIIIGRMSGDNDCLIDTWLMSCRVLGRQVEPATLNLVAQQAKRLGAERLVGEYRPTAKNGMVKNHYANLGFQVIEQDHLKGSRAILDLAEFQPIQTFIVAEEVLE